MPTSRPVIWRQTRQQPEAIARVGIASAYSDNNDNWKLTTRPPWGRQFGWSWKLKRGRNDQNWRCLVSGGSRAAPIEWVVVIKAWYFETL